MHPTVHPFLNWAIFRENLAVMFFNTLKCSMPLKLCFQLGKQKHQNEIRDTGNVLMQSVIVR